MNDEKNDFSFKDISKLALALSIATVTECVIPTAVVAGGVVVAGGTFYVPYKISREIMEGKCERIGDAYERGEYLTFSDNGRYLKNTSHEMLGRAAVESCEKQGFLIVVRK